MCVCVKRERRGGKEGKSSERTLLPSFISLSAGYVTNTNSTVTTTSKRSHFVKSNSETDAHQLERALEEQLQFSEREDRKRQ